MIFVKNTNGDLIAVQELKKRVPVMVNPTSYYVTILSKTDQVKTVYGVDAASATVAAQAWIDEVTADFARTLSGPNAIQVFDDCKLAGVQ